MTPLIEHGPRADSDITGRVTGCSHIRGLRDLVRGFPCTVYAEAEQGSCCFGCPFGRRRALLAADPAVVSVQVIRVASVHVHRAVDVARFVPRPAAQSTSDPGGRQGL